MSDKVSATVSALRAVLEKSRDLKDDLDLKQGWFLERGGFDDVAKALQAEYQKLVTLRTDIRKLLSPVPDDLRGDSATELGKLVDQFGDIEAAMIQLEATQVANTTEARNAHKQLVTAQIDLAKPLKEKIDGAVKAAISETDIANTAIQVKADDDWLKGYEKRLKDVRAMNVGEVVLPSLKGVESFIKQGAERIRERRQPLTEGQRSNIKKFDLIEPDYKKAAEVETKRLEDEAKHLAEQHRVEAERLAKEKLLNAWKVDLASAKGEAQKWKDDDELAEGVEIFGVSGNFNRDLRALRRVVGEICGFDNKTPQPTELAAASAKLSDLSSSLSKAAKAAIASRATDVANALLAVREAVSNKGKEEGDDPYEDDLKEAVKKIPGLIELVRESYRVANYDKAPQVRKRQSRERSVQGQTDKFNRIGGWMNECGLGGAPRTGPYGPVFMSNAVANINGHGAHISQFYANAAVPAALLKSTVDDAMNALFASTGNYTGPHITVELSDDFGSPDNPRLYYHSGRFRPGAVPLEEQTDFEAKMKAALDHAMDNFRRRIAAIVT